MLKMSTTGRNAFATVHFLALEWSLALGEVCQMPEALHPTHSSQVDGGLVNLVAISPLE